MRAFNRSDYERWGNPKSLEPWWESRTRQVAGLIPKRARVIEFGAGLRWLERYLDASCTYIPSDLVDRGPGTIICDLNQRPLPDLRSLRFDVAVFVGVLEYVKDVPSVIRWLSGQVGSCVASYEYASGKPRTPRRLVESLRRAYYGYMNIYTEAEFLAIFARCGFMCTRVETWRDTRLFHFKAGASTPP